MAKDAHNKAAEHHENAAKSHRMAAEHHGKGEHAKGREEIDDGPWPFEDGPRTFRDGARHEPNAEMKRKLERPRCGLFGLARFTVSRTQDDGQSFLGAQHSPSRR